MPLHVPIGEGRGSRGGAPIWVMHSEGFGLMPRGKTSPERIAQLIAQLIAKRDAEGLCGYEVMELAEHGAGDPDGFAVFGRFPKGFLRHFLKLRMLGDVRRGEVLHVCSGTLGPEERWTVDIRPEARPRVVADGSALPFRDASFKAVLMDPPYSDAYARNLYGTENPRPAWLLREAARVVVPGGRIALMHVGIPFAPPACHLVRIWPVSTGVGFRGRWVTIYQKDQAGLF